MYIIVNNNKNREREKSVHFGCTGFSVGGVGERDSPLAADEDLPHGWRLENTTRSEQQMGELAIYTPPGAPDRDSNP